jgi:UTP--glucose-1-phosphate uridylyltransferase
MESFFYLFTRYLTERAKSQDLCVAPDFIRKIIVIDNNIISDWDRIKSPAEDKIVPYAKLPTPSDPRNLNKLAVLKVNGGLGTSMGASFFFCSTNFSSDVPQV